LRIACLVVVGLVASASAAEAQLLSGEPSFRWDYQADVQYLMGQGVGDSFSGTGLALDFAYQIRPSIWFDLGLNVRQSRCAILGDCGRYSGDAAELLAGVKWQLRAGIPLVPYARVGAGPLFLFPSQGENAQGFGVRGDLGVRYFFTDWLGLGVGVGMTLGRASYAASYTGSKTIQVADLVFGAAFQF
jgi:hypothetical protein